MKDGRYTRNQLKRMNDNARPDRGLTSDSREATRPIREDPEDKKNRLQREAFLERVEDQAGEPPTDWDFDYRGTASEKGTTK